MADTRSFARDWQLLKLTRDRRSKERSGEILSRLIADKDPVVMARIEAVMKDLAKSDAQDILLRMHSMMDIETILEAILLISGIDYDIFDDKGVKKIRIKKEMWGGSGDNMLFDSCISAAYIRSFIETVAPKSELIDRGDHFTLIN